MSAFFTFLIGPGLIIFYVFLSMLAAWGAWVTVLFVFRGRVYRASSMRARHEDYAQYLKVQIELRKKSRSVTAKAIRDSFRGKEGVGLSSSFSLPSGILASAEERKLQALYSEIEATLHQLRALNAYGQFDTSDFPASIDSLSNNIADSSVSKERKRSQSLNLGEYGVIGHA